MDKKKQELVLKIIFWLGIIGFFTSAYLVKNHYDNPTQGSFCDFGESISCSLVNTSVYSELFSVPVALFGTIWFFMLLLMSWKALKNEKLVTGLLWFNILGLLFVFYLIYAEIVLQSICPLCTLVHAIVLIVLILSIILYKNQKKLSSKETLKVLKPWIGLFFLLNLIPLIAFNLPTGDKENYDLLAQCLTEKGVNMYSSFRCGVCARTRAMFSDSFQYINEIECHPEGKDSQWQFCLEKGIEGTPTWIFEPDMVEQKRRVGFMSIEELREFSGCDV